MKNIDYIQYLLSNQIILHPKLDYEFLKELELMESQGSVTLLPLYKLQRYQYYLTVGMVG